MESLSENMSDILRKCKMLEDYASLFLRRKNIISNLQDLKSKTEITDDIVMESNKILEEEHTKAIQRYIKLRIRMRNQQLIMLKLIELIKVSIKGAMTELHSVKKSSQLNLMTPLAVKLFKNHNTPKMYLSDYRNSPFVSQMRPMSLLFDFDAKMTVEMFEELPKYMRGRQSFNELVSFLDNILIPCFIEKYELISKKRDFIKKPSEIQMWNMYRAQSSLFPNQKFITQADLTRKLDKLIDKNIQAKITMLRHLNIICEQRKTSIICYIWSSN